MNQRVRAVRQQNLDLFLRRVDHSDKALMARQRRYFRNMVQLPLAKLRFRVMDEEWQGLRTPKRWGADVHVPRVRQVIQLESYDAVPVERVVGLVFSFRKGRARIVSDQTAAGKMLYEGTPAPWDLTPVTVREEPGVLGVFDAETSASADTVTSAVRDGIDEISRALPFSWSGRVVVYSVRNPRVLASFTDVPGGNLEHLGALTFPTYAESGGPQVASTRMLVLPSSVDAGQPFLGRITRHELSHIAVGVRDDGAPAWVSEGLAEYLGAREIPLRDRIIATSALDRARAEVTAMPVSKEFNNTDQEWHYALSWMACDYIAASQRRGPAVGARRCHAQRWSGDERRPAGPRPRAGARVRRCRAGSPRSSADPQPLRLSRGSPRRAGIPTTVAALCALWWESPPQPRCPTKMTSPDDQPIRRRGKPT